MHIIWHGQAFIQIVVPKKEGAINIAIDPFSEEIGLKVPSFSADILLITHDHYDHNNQKVIKGQPVLIDGPGEYEIKGVSLQGIDSFHDDQQGRKRGKNTIYTIEAEGMRICHLGDFGQKELTSDQLEKIGEVDILMIPVGGIYTLDAKMAAKIISQLEPRIVLPIHYKIPKLKIELESLDKFLKVMGFKSIQPQNKLLIKRKDLPTETRLIVLKP